MKKTPNRKPGCFVADSLSGKNFIHPHHVRITGNVKLDGLLIVGGNLTVEGDLQAAYIYCFGSLIVGGSVRKAGEIHVGRSIKVADDLDAMYVRNAIPPEDLAQHIMQEPFTDAISDGDEENMQLT